MLKLTVVLLSGLASLISCSAMARSDFGGRTAVGTFDQSLAKTAARLKLPFPDVLERVCKPNGDKHQCNYMVTPSTVVYAIGNSERSDVLGLMVFCVAAEVDDQCATALKLTMMTIDPDFPEKRHDDVIAQLKSFVAAGKSDSTAAGLTALYHLFIRTDDAGAKRIQVFIRTRD
jgi:hypothetical protein